MKNSWRLLPVAGLLAVLLTLAKSEPMDQVLAAGRGFSISRAQLAEEERVHQDEVAEMQADGLPRSTIDWKSLQNLINKYVMLAGAGDADKVVAQENFKRELQQHKAQVKVTDEAFEQELASQLDHWQMSRQRWEERCVEGYLADVVAKRQIEATLTSEEIAKYYWAHLHSFDLPEKIRAGLILLCTVDRASGLRLSAAEIEAKHTQMEKILQRARKGEDFAALAKVYSEAGAANDPNGDYVFQPGQSTPEFEGTVFALEPGTISDVITTDSGYQIVKVREKTPAHTLTIEEASPLIRRSLMIEQAGPCLAVARAKAGTEILDPALKAEAQKRAGENKS